MKLDRTRLIALGGAFGAVAVFALGWFLLISPQRQSASDLNSQADNLRTATLVARHSVALLHKENLALAQDKATLARDRLGLPAETGTPDLLRDLQTLAATSSVSVASIEAGSATSTNGASTTSGTGVVSLPIVIAVAGDPTELDAFMTGLQLSVPRALLITSVTESPAQSDSATTDTVSTRMALTIDLQAFVDPASAATH